MSGPERSRKRSFSDAIEPASIENASPVLVLFEGFRTELDEHHERRERLIKCSRDITAASKKIIFSLQRTPSLNQPLPASIIKSCDPHFTILRTNFTAAAADLQGSNRNRYHRNISPGIQEYIEAAAFQHYLETQTLLSHDAAASGLNALVQRHEPAMEPLELTREDYVLGLYDMTGELMRYAITAMATTGRLPGSPGAISAAAMPSMSGRDVLTDMRELCAALARLDVEPESWFAREAAKKMVVLRACVEKVENAVYGLIIRGQERPLGWLPPEKEQDQGREGEIRGY